MIAMGWNREGANRGETRPAIPEEIAHVRHALREKFAALVEALATAPAQRSEEAQAIEESERQRPGDGRQCTEGTGSDVGFVLKSGRPMVNTRSPGVRARPIELSFADAPFGSVWRRHAP